MHAAIALFVACSTLGDRGTIPRLPEEIRELVYRRYWQGGVPHSFTCRHCTRVLCIARVGSASSYDNLLRLERVCLGCYSAALI